MKNRFQILSGIAEAIDRHVAAGHRRRARALAWPLLWLRFRWMAHLAPGGWWRLQDSLDHALTLDDLRSRRALRLGVSRAFAGLVGPREGK